MHSESHKNDENNEQRQASLPFLPKTSTLEAWDSCRDRTKATNKNLPLFYYEVLNQRLQLLTSEQPRQADQLQQQSALHLEWVANSLLPTFWVEKKKGINRILHFLIQNNSKKNVSEPITSHKVFLTAAGSFLFTSIRFGMHFRLSS